MANELSTNGIHPAIANHYEGMNAALHDRDRLSSLARDLQSELIVTQKLNTEMREQIRTLADERDYYYRKAYAFENKLSDMKGMIDGLFSLVDFEAENSPMTAPKLPVASNIGSEPKMTEEELLKGLEK